MQNKIMQKFLLATFVATLFTAQVNANTLNIYNKHELQFCNIPPAILDAYNAFIQKFGTPTSANLISYNRQGNLYTVVAVLTFSGGSAKTFTVNFTKDGSVLNYTYK
jgi:hypothetical protein